MIKIRSKIFLFIFFSLAIHADIKLSSPIVDLNSTNQRTIEFKIRNAELKENEIELFSYRTTEPLIGIIEYSLAVGSSLVRPPRRRSSDRGVNGRAGRPQCPAG